MPILAATSIRFLPLVLTTSLPSMVSLIGSIKAKNYLGNWNNGILESWAAPTFHYSNFPLFHSYCAPLLRDVLFKLFTILFYESCRRHRRGVPEWANRVAHNVAANVQNQFQISVSPLALLDAVKDLFHPVTPFAAGTALATGLMSEKPREVPCGSNHTGGIVHHNDPARTEKTSCGLDGFIVEIHLLQFVRAQHRHRTATGNDTLQFSAVGHAAAVFPKEFHERIAHLQYIDTGFADVAAHAKELGPFAFFRSYGRVRRCAVLDDPGKRRQGLDIVDHRRAAEQAVGRRKGRFNFGPTSSTFKRRQ